jgi:phospholipase/carboxylesterase
MTLTLDDDAVLWSHPESERGGKPLLLLLHGKGSHEGDLVSLVPHFPRFFTFASLRAPISDGPGFSWFFMTTRGDPPQDAVNAAADAVLAWLDALPFEPPSVGLLGFSQGGVISLQTLRRAPERIAYVFNLSGFVARGDEPGDRAISEHPVFWGRGDADPIIGNDAIERTRAWLSDHVDEPDIEVYPGLGHAISIDELDDIDAWLEARLAD